MSPPRGLYLARAVKILSPLTAGCERLALRRFNCPNTYAKNVKYIDLDSCLSFLSKHTKLRSKVLRDKISSVEDPKSLAPMRKWEMELDHSIDWIGVFSNLFFTLTNHFKLIQFHYKLWHRISTCRYMRQKMRIDLDSPRCSLCNGDIETLEHIFLNCYHTREFVKKTAEFIVRYLDSSYKDNKGYHRLTLSHSNPHINLVNSVANWHIGKKFQNKNHLDFLEYTRELNHFLLGEKAPLANKLKNILHQ